MNILLIGYETESCSLAVLGSRLQADGHDVRLLNADCHNFVNDSSIQEFYAEHGFEDWTNFRQEYELLHQTEPEVDWEFLSEFEDRHTVNKNLQQLLLSDPILTRYHHHRNPYYTPIESEELVYYWAELLIRWLQRHFNQFEPDLVFTYKRNYFVKNAAAQYAMAIQTPILTLIKSRVKEYCHLVRHFGYGADPDAKTYLEGDTGDQDWRAAEAHATAFREGGDYTTLYDAHSQEGIREDRPLTLRKITSDWVSNISDLLIRRIVLRNKFNFREGRNLGNHFDSHTTSQLRFHTNLATTRLEILRDSPFHDRLPERPFIYFPLHTLPESSTLTLSKEYFEIDLIRYISKELPAGYVVGVKENPNMLGIRPYEVYKELTEIPNVRLLSAQVPSKRLAEASVGVCGVSGTALLEAALLGKPTHAFGYPEFMDVLDYNGHPEFRAFVSACADGTSDSNPQRAERYLQYVFDRGRPLSLSGLRNDQESNAFNQRVNTVYEMLSPHIETLPDPVQDPDTLVS